jgi:hypothetical protein
MNRIRFPHRPWRTVLPALLLTVTMIGCGSRRAEVSGMVRYNGKPLPAGTIQFLGSDGLAYPAQIQPDGTFSVRVPAGEAKVIIRCVDEDRLSRITAQMAGNRGRVSAPSGLAIRNLSLIPQRYADWSTSRLTVLVERGKTTQDFDLTPD